MFAQGDCVRVCHVGYTQSLYWKDATLIERISYPNGQRGWMVEIKDHPGEWFVPDDHIIVKYDYMTSKWLVRALREHNAQMPCYCLRCKIVRRITPMVVRIHMAIGNWRYARIAKKAIEDARASR